MPRYFFHVIDGTVLLDHDGTELPDLHAARAMAIHTSGELLCGLEEHWDGTEWHMEVADEAGRVLLALHFVVEQEPSRPMSRSISNRISHPNQT